jgi:hypothetical protein
MMAATLGAKFGMAHSLRSPIDIGNFVTRCVPIRVRRLGNSRPMATVQDAVHGALEPGSLF